MDEAGLAEFEARRGRLFGLAYRMLGSASEAEDAVQETYLRWEGADRTVIRCAEAWLTTAVVNLCRTWLVSARARRETYAGPWLPEPVPTDGGELGPLETAEEREQVSLALLTTLERLSAVERAVFVLREAFGYTHREIADMLDISESASQQHLRRAGQRVREGRARFEVDRSRVAELLARFLKATRDGDVAGLQALLTADATTVADGGGIVNTARRSVVGANNVARYLIGIFRREVPEMRSETRSINGAPAEVVWFGPYPVVVVSIDVAAEGIARVRLMVNPEKLAYLARTASGGL